MRIFFPMTPSYFNPLLPCAHKIALIAEILVLKLEGIIKKFPMSVAPISYEVLLLNLSLYYY